MNPGEILLTSLQQADGKWKLRPTLCLSAMPPFDDLLVCGISTQLQHAVANFDDIINSSDVDFGGAGLKTTSLIRLGYLAVVPKSQVQGRLGVIAATRRDRLLVRLSDFLRP